MPKLVYVDSDGVETMVDATVGESVMVSAVNNGVAGIIGECGGNMSCATCHVWVRDEFRDQVGPAEDLEDDLLDLGGLRAAGRQPAVLPDRGHREHSTASPSTCRPSSRDAPVDPDFVDIGIMV